MAPALQAKLLRVLEDGEVRAVGADASRKVDVRVIAATHQDLEARVRAGSFRADLFYRLNVVPIAVPPLRERARTSRCSSSTSSPRARARNPRSPVAHSPDAVAALARRSWPGNVRELENLMERLVIVSTKETPSAANLVELAASAGQAAPAPADPVAEARAPLLQRFVGEGLVSLRQLEREYISHVVREVGGNKTRAAEILGIDVSTIHRKEREQKG